MDRLKGGRKGGSQRHAKSLVSNVGQALKQPRSQGLLSSHPLEQERRDLGTGLSHATLTTWKFEGGVLSDKVICRIDFCQIQSIALQLPLPVITCDV